MMLSECSYGSAERAHTLTAKIHSEVDAFERLSRKKIEVMINKKKRNDVPGRVTSFVLLCSTVLDLEP